MRAFYSELAAYGALIIAVIISVLLGDALPWPYGTPAAIAGTIFGVFAAAQIGRLSYFGVASVILLLAVAAPVVLLYTWGWQIAASALAMGAESVGVPVKVSVTWLAALPVFAGILALWTHRHLTFRGSGR